ncbi:MAG TPA: type II toxin-antitoxin system ParD family antitoxin [Hyphomonadaceae bacterium]|jgi:antitoxin ParD1/3/4|nr:type II toxin-antitoxin system ParD family antitoxin [Hyphomonadaceae bacterium]
MTTKLSISFTDTHAKIIEDAVKSGQYASASEFVREALRLREKRIDDAIDAGIASGFAEPDEPIEAIIREGKRRLKKRK